MNKLFIILTPIIIILLSFKITLFALTFYLDDLDSKNIVDYIKNKAELKTNLSERETLHLNDVKVLMTYTNVLFYFLLIIYGLILFNLKRNIPQTVITAGKTTLILILILLSGVMIFFKPLFIALHHLLFRNDLWLLPKDSVLLQLFPQSFFSTFAVILLILAIIACIGLIWTGIQIKRFLKANIYKNARGEGGAK